MLAKGSGARIYLLCAPTFHLHDALKRRRHCRLLRMSYCSHRLDNFHTPAMATKCANKPSFAKTGREKTHAFVRLFLTPFRLGAPRLGYKRSISKCLIVFYLSFTDLWGPKMPAGRAQTVYKRRQLRRLCM